MKKKRVNKTPVAVKAEIIPEKEEIKFTVEQLLASKQFSNRRDALGAILDGSQKYSISEAEKLLNDFMKGRVN